jgi:guanylate kinase
MKKGMLIVISGPAGCGKDTIVEGLLKTRTNFDNGLFYSVSATTRGIRKNETDGKHYIFKTREEFEKLIEQGEFLEYTEYCGNYYGTLKKTVMDTLDEGKNIILKIEVEGAANVRKLFNECNRSTAKFVAIFIQPPSLEELRRRLKARETEDDATIERRIQRAVQEMARSGGYDHRVVNDDLQTAIDETAAIIREELERPIKNHE